jgi:hypothetical protein
MKTIYQYFIPRIKHLLLNIQMQWDEKLKDYISILKVHTGRFA